MSLAHELRRRKPDYRLVYVGLRGQKISVDEKLFDNVEYITAGKLRRYAGRPWWRSLIDLKTLALNIVDSFKLAAGSWQARWLIKRYKPALVFSKGSYVAVPVGLAAHWAAVPIVTHDSDATAGLANRLIGRWAKWHATGWPKGLYQYPPSSTYYTGIPLNPAIKPVDSKLMADYRRQLGYQSDDLLLLVGGAGLGSGRLNSLTVASAARLLDKYPNLQIVHLTGNDHLETVSNDYKTLSADQSRRLKAMPFSDKFYVYSGAADLVVSRAGATSIAEFAAQAKACILIPADWLPGGQQTENAKLVAAAKAAVIVGNDISPADYYDLISRLLNDSAERRRLGQRLHKLTKADGAKALAELIIQAVEEPLRHEV